MSMISEQVNRLRELALKNSENPNAMFLKHCADTIEELSAKLANANMERSTEYYNGGWIPCSERLPEEHKLYDVTTRNDVGIHSDSAIWHPQRKTWYWDEDERIKVGIEVLAWAEKREPYKNGGE